MDSPDRSTGPLSPCGERHERLGPEASAMSCVKFRYQLLAAAKRYCGRDLHGAEDAVQETFRVAAAEGLDAQCGACRKRLFGICRNQGLTIRRRGSTSTRATTPLNENVPDRAEVGSRPRLGVLDTELAARVETYRARDREVRRHFQGGWAEATRHDAAMKALDDRCLETCLDHVELAFEIRPGSYLRANVRAAFTAFLRDYVGLKWKPILGILAPQAAPGRSADRSALTRYKRALTERRLNYRVVLASGSERLMRDDGFRQHFVKLLEDRIDAGSR